MSRADEPVSVEVDRTVVMLSIEQGMYYGMEGVGPRIWSLLSRPRSVGSLCAELQAEYEVDPEECRRDVCTFLDELRRSDLIRIHDTPADSAGATAGR